jgi:hypothetical protein
MDEEGPPKRRYVSIKLHNVTCQKSENRNIHRHENLSYQTLIVF